MLATSAHLPLAFAAPPVLGRDLANCSRTRLCNGDYLCADVCKLGTVVPDSHTARALALQRALTYDDRLARQQLIGSHNSAIAQPYGYGIEMDGFEVLLNETLYKNDDLGEGVDQTFTLTDQLNLGLRHLEIDITAGYFKLPLPKLDEFFVCHSPVPLDPESVLKLEAAALTHHVKLGAWDAGKLSCLGTNMLLRTAFIEVRSWLDANPREFVVLFLDTKPLTMTGKGQANAMSALIREVFNTSVWAAADGDRDVLLNQTVSSLVARGKRLYIEDHEDAYNQADDKIVFSSALWSHQFGAGDLSPFPDCAIAGDRAWYTTVGGAAHPFPRGLYDGGSTLSDAPAAHDAKRAAATACGVNIVSPNYVQPRDMAAFAWTWGAGEPQTSAADACVVQTPDGRWATRGCADARQLQLACRKSDDDRTWTLAAPGATCGAGWLARPPTNGFANGLLRAAANNATVLLNVSVDGRAGAPVLA